MCELPTYTDGAFHDKENGHPNVATLHKSAENIKVDDIRAEQAQLQAQLELLGMRTDIPCTPRIVARPEDLPPPLLPIADDSKNPDLRSLDSNTVRSLSLKPDRQLLVSWSRFPSPSTC